MNALRRPFPEDPNSNACMSLSKLDVASSSLVSRPNALKSGSSFFYPSG
jgi:hypothetical protein